MPIGFDDEALQRAYEQKKKEDEGGSSAGFDVGNEDKLVLEPHMTVCRIVNLPVFSEWSFIRDDAEKLKLFKFPDKTKNPDFILYRIIDKVLYEVYHRGKTKGDYTIEAPIKESNPDIYWMIYNNGDMNLGKFGANGWGTWKKANGTYGGHGANTSCLLNVINRKEFSVSTTKKVNDQEVTETKHYEKDWCVRNGHTLLLSKNARSIGVPQTVGNMLLENLTPNYGSYYHFDVAIERTKSMPYYAVHKADTMEKNVDVFPYVCKGPVSEAESKIEPYDLAELSKPSTNSFIFQNLKSKIEKIDNALSTHFLEDLETAVNMESNGEIKTKSSSQTPVNIDLKKEETPKPVQQEEPKPAPARRVVRENPPAASANNSMDAVKKVCFSYTKGPNTGKNAIDRLKPEELELIKGVGADGKLEFNTTDTIDCPVCKGIQPMAIGTCCLYCGVDF